MSTRDSAPSSPQEVFASAREWEALTGSDQNITINGGVAHAIYSETAGDVIVAATTKQAATALPLLEKGMNAFSIVSVTGTGTTLAGNTWAVSF